MDFDGTGTVTQGIGFDAAALARVGDRARALRADDLAQAGWVIESVVTEGGLTWISISHGFDTPEQADDLFAQLSSPDGPFRDKARADAFGGDASGGLLARIEKEEGRSAAEMVDPDLSVTTGGVSRTWSASFSEPSVQQPKDSDSRWKNPDLLGRVLLVVLVVLSVAVIALRIRVQGRARRRLMRRTARRW
ncbi:MAG: hypothetical protein FGM58_02040 [Acidimicrobiia bacterium]|nr:hypothetical protein [Acidimicrobiia bacterium]